MTMNKIQTFLVLCCWSLLSSAETAAPRLGTQGFIDQLEVQLENKWQSQFPEQNNAIRSRAKIKSLQAGYQPPACPSGFRIKSKVALKPGRNGIQVFCPDKHQWQLYLAAEIQLWQNVVTLSSPLRRGETINRQHISLQNQNTASLVKDHFNKLEAVLGTVSKRRLQPGTILSPDMVTTPILIKKRQEIRLVSRSPRLTVEMKGVSLMTGRQGDYIRVKNLRSGKVVSGKVMKDGSVEVN